MLVNLIPSGRIECAGLNIIVVSIIDNINIAKHIFVKMVILKFEIKC